MRRPTIFNLHATGGPMVKRYYMSGWQLHALVAKTLGSRQYFAMTLGEQNILIQKWLNKLKYRRSYPTPVLYRTYQSIPSIG